MRLGRPLGEPEFRPAAFGGRFPLQPGAAARKQRERRVLRRRGARTRHLLRALRQGVRELLGDHGADPRFSVSRNTARARPPWCFRIWWRRRAISASGCSSARSSRSPTPFSSCKARSPISSPPTTTSPTGLAVLHRLASFRDRVDEIHADIAEAPADRGRARRRRRRGRRSRARRCPTERRCGRA